MALAHGRLLGTALAAEMTQGRGVEPELVMGGDREWGLGVAMDPDGYGMGGFGGSFGWWSEAGQYAAAFLTGHSGAYDRGTGWRALCATRWAFRRCNRLRRSAKQ